jgi:hypothetical protein
VLQYPLSSPHMHAHILHGPYRNLKHMLRHPTHPPPTPNTQTHTLVLQYYLEQTLAMEMWWRSAALQSLLAFVHGVILPLPPSKEHKALVRGLLGLLRSTLAIITKHPALAEPARAKGGPGGTFAAAAGLMLLRLLEVYLALPSPAAYSPDHEALTKICMRTMRSAAATGSQQIMLSMLQKLLDRWEGEGGRRRHWCANACLQRVHS